MEQRDLLAKLTALLMKTRDEPGTRMPSERTLAGHFDVSRGQIREALAILEVLRVVERKAKSGIYLTENRASIEALAFFAQAGLPLLPEEVYQAVEMRKIHEITAVRLACERAKLENFERMREVLDRSAKRIEEAQPINIEDR
ncbi:MAG TPA: GntR family transcriptional regulator, partial [Methyloceanibacter sp.]